MTRLFVAGATGFLGRAIAKQDVAQHGVELVLQARPGSAGRARLGDDRRICEVDLADADGLSASFRECDAVLQLIGTTRARFAEGGDYEKVDYGTTVQLVEAAKRAQVGHFVLVSSAGPERGGGAYLAWKRRAEKAVRDSGLDATITRPSFIGGDAEFPERKSHEALGAFLRGLSETPLSRWTMDYRPMNVQLLALVLLRIARDRAPIGLVKGRSLWRIAKEHNLYPWVR